MMLRCCGLLRLGKLWVEACRGDEGHDEEEKEEEGADGERREKDFVIFFSFQI